MKKELFSVLLLCASLVAFTQNNIGIGTQTPHASAVLDASSTTKGMLVPRMTTSQRNAIANPAQGLLVYDVTSNGFMYYNGAVWTPITGSGSGTGIFSVNNGVIHNTGDTATNHFVFGRTSLPKNNEAIGDNFMFFDKNKGALRSGGLRADGYNWSQGSIGHYSVGLGENNLASGYSSVALNTNNSASGDYSIALGYYTQSSGIYSMAMGNYTKASSAYTFAGGNQSESSNSISFSYGNENKAKGGISAVFGNQNIANAQNLFVIGRWNDTLNGNATNWVDTDALFMIGNGTGNASRRNALTVLKNGNVGLGTSNPATLLHLKKNSGHSAGQIILEETADNTDGARITYKNSGSNFSWDLYGNTGIDLTSQARFNFTFNNPNPGGIIRDVLTLTGLGQVGIGNANPNAALDVISNANSGVPQIRARVNTSDYVRFRMANTVSANSYWDMASITSSTTSSTAYFNFFYFHNAQGGSNILTLQGNGNATLSGTLTQNSDERLKKDITAIDNPIPLLKQLKGYHYKWKDEWRDSTIQTGLLAQEVEKLIPELVKEDDKGIKSVNYTGLIPYLLEAIKQLEARIETLESHK